MPLLPHFSSSLLGWVSVTGSRHSVNPIYYVFFTTATIIASAILFQGFNTTSAVNTISLICGFLIIFMGVYLLNISRQAEAPHHATSLEAGLMSESTSLPFGLYEAMNSICSFSRPPNVHVRPNINRPRSRNRMELWRPTDLRARRTKRPRQKIKHISTTE